jgi:hypothetical protein
MANFTCVSLAKIHGDFAARYHVFFYPRNHESAEQYMVLIYTWLLKVTRVMPAIWHMGVVAFKIRVGAVFGVGESDATGSRW